MLRPSQYARGTVGAAVGASDVDVVDVADGAVDGAAVGAWEVGDALGDAVGTAQVAWFAQHSNFRFIPHPVLVSLRVAVTWVPTTEMVNQSSQVSVDNQFVLSTREGHPRELGPAKAVTVTTFELVF